jgi:BirA family biotin operon repressor/biotin-[acetyl-CoA-carboxylase] ligase
MSAASATRWRIERHETLPSTNDRAIAAAAAGEAPGLVVLAREQTAGRGRAGRPWVSRRGNLFCSVLLPAGAVPPGGAASLLVGLAAHDALAGLVPPPHALRLKWPNDLLVGGAKLGGVLVESGATAGGATWLVAGIGANLAAAPEGLGRPATSLAALGGAATPEEVAAALAAALAARLAGFAASGMPWLIEAWSARALPEGTAMTVEGGSGRLSGRYAGLDGDGALLLATGEGLRRVVAGEVSAEV